MKALLAKQKMINKVVLIPEHRIKPNPYQPRRVFDQEKIEQLAASIAQYGLLQPITVLPLEDGSYQLVAGERRLLACRRLRMQEVPAILTTMDEERSSALALVENIQRCDLNFFEEAAAIQKLMKMGGYTQQAVAKKLGKINRPSPISCACCSFPSRCGRRSSRQTSPNATPALCLTSMSRGTSRSCRRSRRFRSGR